MEPPSILQRPNFDVAVTIDVKIIAAPPIHIVSGNGRFDVPVSFIILFWQERNVSRAHFHSERGTCKQRLTANNHDLFTT